MKNLLLLIGITIPIIFLTTTTNTYSEEEEKEPKSLLDYAKQKFKQMNELCLKYDELDAVEEIKNPEFKEYCKEYLD